jgi:hypothetical protein
MFSALATNIPVYPEGSGYLNYLTQDINGFMTEDT